jgi:hypothetical protein
MEGTAEELPWRILEEESKTRMSNDRPAETSARPLQETSRGSATTDDTSARQWLCDFASVVRPNVGGNVVTGGVNGVHGVVGKCNQREIKEAGA